MSKLCRFSFVLSMTTILSGVGVSQAAVRHKVATGRFASAQNVKKSRAPKPRIMSILGTSLTEQIGKAVLQGSSYTSGLKIYQSTTAG